MCVCAYSSSLYRVQQHRARAHPDTARSRSLIGLAAPRLQEANGSLGRPSSPRAAPRRARPVATARAQKAAMAHKRRASGELDGLHAAGEPEEDESVVEIKPLGAGQEVGRSCLI